MFQKYLPTSYLAVVLLCKATAPKRNCDRCKMQSSKIRKYDPTRDKKCSKCKFLPICMGGCPRDVYDRPNVRCVYYKKLHKKYITQIASAIDSQPNDSNN